LPKQPVVSAKDLLKMMTKMGYEIQRQKGSHIRLRKVTPIGEHHITVPFKDEIAKGTLNDIINNLSIQNSLPKEELLKMLRGE
jgi:predicted RNA binding protein YcfA (HicA-like mRNA interferase family)